jgi:hypothetical protein
MIGIQDASRNVRHEVGQGAVWSIGAPLDTLSSRHCRPLSHISMHLVSDHGDHAIAMNFTDTWAAELDEGFLTDLDADGEVDSSIFSSSSSSMISEEEDAKPAMDPRSNSIILNSDDDAKSVMDSSSDEDAKPVIESSSSGGDAKPVIESSSSDGDAEPAVDTSSWDEGVKAPMNPPSIRADIENQSRLFWSKYNPN